jgi:hypothetical protein
MASRRMKATELENALTILERRRTSRFTQPVNRQPKIEVFKAPALSGAFLIATSANQPTRFYGYYCWVKEPMPGPTGIGGRGTDDNCSACG